MINVWFEIMVGEIVVKSPYELPLSPIQLLYTIVLRIRLMMIIIMIIIIIIIIISSSSISNSRNSTIGIIAYVPTQLRYTIGRAGVEWVKLKDPTLLLIIKL